MSKKPTKTTPVTHAEHFRLRLPSERPTRKDSDSQEEILIVFGNGEMDLIKWDDFVLYDNIAGWHPGRLPAHLIPKPETTEERMRREFEEWAKANRFLLSKYGTGYSSKDTQFAWLAWQAAKTTP